MSRKKELNSERAAERGRQAAITAAILAERNRCASICEQYADRAEQHGLIVHPQLARAFATEIRKEPA